MNYVSDKINVSHIKPVKLACSGTSLSSSGKQNSPHTLSMGNDAAHFIWCVADGLFLLFPDRHVRDFLPTNCLPRMRQSVATMCFCDIGDRCERSPIHSFTLSAVMQSTGYLVHFGSRYLRT